MATMKPPRILTIAGSDSGGGAGIQADIKTVSALGGYAMSAITAITAQNTLGVHAVDAVSTDLLRAQIDACLSDIGVDAVKIGMVPSAEHVEVIAALIDTYDLYNKRVPIVYDPVMISTSGTQLMAQSAIDAVKNRLLPRCEVVTPNLDEVEVLSGRSSRSPDDVKEAGADIMTRLGANSVLVTGGHGDDDVIRDILIHQAGEKVFSNTRIKTDNTHGTGCTLSSALAVELGRGTRLEEAVERAISCVRGALDASFDLGGGNGPLNHNHVTGRTE